MMRQKGMTLIELMVVMVVASIIGIAVLNMFTVSNRTFMDQNKIIDVQRDGRLVMEYLARNFREAGLSPHASKELDGTRRFRGVRGIIPVLPLGPGPYYPILKIWFDRDSNVDGIFDNDEMVELAFNPGTGIMKRTFSDKDGNILSSQDIAKNIISFEVNPRDAGDGSSLLNPEDTRVIMARISFKDTKFSGGDFTRTYSIRIDLRNL